MIESLEFITELIRVDLIIGFGLYSILYFLLRRFLKRKEFLQSIDRTAVRITLFAGLAFTLAWLTGLKWTYMSLDNEMDKMAFNQRLTGPYWFGYWLQPLFWIVLTQLLWIKALQQSLVFRLLLSALFIFSFERIVIIITSFHRDYLPSSWSLGLSSTEILVGLLLKTALFTLIVLGVHFGMKGIKNLLKSTAGRSQEHSSSQKS